MVENISFKFAKKVMVSGKVQVIAILCITAIVFCGLLTGHNSTLVAFGAGLIGAIAGVAIDVIRQIWKGKSNNKT